MIPTVDVINIGQLACNPYWGETEPKRVPVATTTLIRSGDAILLVDPSLPPQVLKAQLRDRAGIRPEQVTGVFLTSFHPTHRRGLELFDDAIWHISLSERDQVGRHLSDMLESPAATDQDMIEAELALLGRTQPAADLLAEGVHLFPCPGVTLGSAGLLVAAIRTYLVAGDAILTRDHLEHGAVSEHAIDPTQAKASLAEIYEIADVIIPGHDNLFVSSSRIGAGF